LMKCITMEIGFIFCSHYFRLLLYLKWDNAPICLSSAPHGCD
jgi:hypothetical protein